MSSRPGKLRKPKKVLSTIPGFEEARIKEQLSDGPTNASYLVEQSGAQYVLRLDKTAAADLGLNRWREKQLCEEVATTGIAPEPVCFDPEAGVYLRHFIPGRCWAESDLQVADNLKSLAKALRLLHSLQGSGAEFDPLAALRRYAKELDTRQAYSIESRAMDLYENSGSPPARKVLCHNDLVCQNILVDSSSEQGRLWLIDFEYAGIGDPFFDLAIVVQHHRLDDELAEAFLHSYLGRRASERESEHLRKQCSFYQCLLDLWHLRITM